MNTLACQNSNCPETDLPAVTVVTVVYNDVHNIEKTLLSVISQQYPKLEYIVIDGGSTDGTVDTIKKYESHIDRWISEKDRGIYDAMNKGIDLASGEWINFMNAKDMFYNKTTIYDVFKDAPKDVDFIYGDFIRRHPAKDEYVGMYRPIEELWKDMSFSHQTLFSRTHLLKQNKFCLKNRIISDYEFIFLHYINGGKFFNSGKPIAIIAPTGFSNNFFPKTLERWKLVRKHLNYKIDIYFMLLIAAYILENYFSPRITQFLIEKMAATTHGKKALSASTENLLKKKDSF